MGIEKPYREEYEKLLNKQQEEKKEFIDKAHEEALKDEQRLKELLRQEIEIKGAKPEKAQKAQELRGEISLEKAQEILGKDFLGPEAVKNVFGVELETIPPIKYAEGKLITREDLERAKELGQMLILQIDKMEDDKPITLENLKKKFPTAHDGEKMWYDQDWYNNEDFFKNETPRAGWKFVSKEVIPDSTRKNYLEQTETIVQYLKDEVFKDRELPKEYQEAIAEFESQRFNISKLIDSDWKSAADKLEALQITRLTRENPSEVMYRLILQDKENKEKLLPIEYTWTLRRYSDGRFVYVGSLGDDGTSVLVIRPDGRHDDLGFSFSRFC